MRGEHFREEGVRLSASCSTFLEVHASRKTESPTVRLEEDESLPTAVVGCSEARCRALFRKKVATKVVSTLSRPVPIVCAVEDTDN